MDENNVFNSFSFKKWARFVREQRMEEEIRRQRMEQVIRLRNKLVRERALRDQTDLLTEEDVDKLVHYMDTAHKSFAGIATGVQSTFRFGRRQNVVSGRVPIPTVSATIRPETNAQIPGSSSQSGLKTERDVEGDVQHPHELSQRMPAEVPRDGHYIFGEIPILAPLHPPRQQAGTSCNQQKDGTFQHNVRFAEPTTKTVRIDVAPKNRQFSHNKEPKKS